VTDPELESALVDFAAAIRARADADEIFEQCRAVVHERLATLGTEYLESGERAIDDEIVCRLYWSFPDVHVKAIGLAIGVRTGQVHELAGETAEIRCHDCRRAFAVRAASRSALKTGRGYSGICAECEQRRHARWRAMDAERRDRNERERLERIHALEAGDYWIDEDGDIIWPYVDFLVDHYNPEQTERCAGPHRLTNWGPVWRAGGEAIFVCSRCRDTRRVLLVTYVPASTVDRAP
jgi:hypothetical protein